MPFIKCLSLFSTNYLQHQLYWTTTTTSSRKQTETLQLSLIVFRSFLFRLRKSIIEAKMMFHFSILKCLSRRYYGKYRQSKRTILQSLWSWQSTFDWKNVRKWSNIEHNQCQLGGLWNSINAFINCKSFYSSFCFSRRFSSTCFRLQPMVMILLLMFFYVIMPK